MVLKEDVRGDTEGWDGIKGKKRSKTNNYDLVNE